MPSPLVRLVHPAGIYPHPSSDWSLLLGPGRRSWAGSGWEGAGELRGLREGGPEAARLRRRWRRRRRRRRRLARQVCAGVERRPSVNMGHGIRRLRSSSARSLGLGTRHCRTDRFNSPADSLRTACVHVEPYQSRFDTRLLSKNTYRRKGELTGGRENSPVGGIQLTKLPCGFMPSPLVRLVHPSGICPLPWSDGSALRVYALSPRPIGPPCGSAVVGGEWVGARALKLVRTHAEIGAGMILLARPG
eukprot:953238-Prorocentrum_minimum.AAC.1